MTELTNQAVLQYLLDSGDAEYPVKVKWGNGHRNVVIFEGRKYQYNGHGEINKRLMKSILPLYIRMSNKALDKKTIITTNLTEIATADLKFDYDKNEGRSWVNTYKFAEFIEQHEEIQENSSLNNGSSVQFNIKVKLKNITDAKIEYRNAFPPMTTVYGGVKGIQAF